MPELPVVVVPVGIDDVPLDRCLAALDASTPPGTRVWLADDAQAGPRSVAIIEGWRTRTALDPHCTRRRRPIGEAAHLAEVLAACGDADVAVLAPDAAPAPGWLEHLAACLARDASIATATPWCNAGETAAWPRIGRIEALPASPARLARAAASLPATAPDLPAAVGHAVLLRGAACRAAGGPDAASFGSCSAALTDLSRRLAGLGGRNVLCPQAFVARDAEGVTADGDMDRLAARWPDWHSRIAEFLMRDPLHELREELARALARLDAPAMQRELFPALGLPAAAGVPVSCATSAAHAEGSAEAIESAA